MITLRSGVLFCFLDFWFLVFVARCWHFFADGLFLAVLVNEKGRGQRGGGSFGDRGHFGARRDGDRHVGAAEAFGGAERVH